MLPVVAIVGRPNVGKSTLFNRMVGGMRATVEDRPGVTRDRHYARAEVAGKLCVFVDTGGFLAEPAGRKSAGGRTPSTQIEALVADQVRLAIDEATLVLLVVDARAGLQAEELDLARLLRRAHKPFIIVANKVDDEKVESDAAAAHRLGPDVVAMSAAHGRNSGELVDAIAAMIPASADDASHDASPDASDDAIDDAIDDLDDSNSDENYAPTDDANDNAIDDATDDTAGDPERAVLIRLAIVGRPNAGKSSLLNILCGTQRAVVHDAPGTTVDPVDAMVAFGNTQFRIVDTAGIRRRQTGAQLTERVAILRAVRAIGAADVCALVIDSSVGFSAQDAHIAGLIEEQGRALVIVFNKWDLVEGGSRAAETRAREQVAERVPSWDHAPLAFVSAQTGFRATTLLELARTVWDGYSSRVKTGPLNRWLEHAVVRHAPPSSGGRPLRFYYATQTRTRPPTFIISTNRPELVPNTYRRYLINQMRATYGLAGSPIRFRFRPRRAADRQRRTAKG